MADTYTIKASIYGEKIIVRDLTTLAECAAAWRRERDLRGAGASDCGVVYAYTGRTRLLKVARISYNGRVWDLDGVEIATVSKVEATV